MTRTAWLAAVVVAAVGVARADTIDTTFFGTDPSQTVFVSGVRNIGDAPRAFNSPVGVFNFTVDANNSSLPFGQSFRSFCADYFQDVALPDPNNPDPALRTTGKYKYTTEAFTSLPDVNGDPAKTRALQQLFDRHYQGVTNGETAAAFQLALWKILYDPGSSDFTTGHFLASDPNDPNLPRTPATGIGVASGWLNDIYSAAPDVAKKFDLVGLYNPEFQDQITPFPVNPVPAPAGVVLLVIGAAGLVARRFAGKKDAEPTAEETAA